MTRGNARHAHPLDGRARHYAEFLAGPGPGARGTDERAIVLVHGNCQAESLRIMLAAPELATVRMPPVHELTASDLPALGRWLAHADAIVAQPIRANYRRLPIGTADVLAAARPGVRLVLVPVLRDASLYPEQAIVRPPHDPGASPPLVPYHSLRTLAEAAGILRSRPAPLTPRSVRSIAARSLAELRRREQAHGTVPVSDVLARPSFAHMRTINHPGNALFTVLARRVLRALGRPEEPVDPGRPLLDAVHAPREPEVIEAFGLDVEPESDWRVGGRRVETGAVREAHLAWYRSHPDAVAAGLARHEVALRTLGLT